MPRKTPLAESEKQIGKRVAAIRMFSHLNQSELAQRIGTSPGLIANVEAGRSPLRTRMALRICRQLKVNPQWLATGENSPTLKGILAGEPSHPDMLFGEYFRQFLSDQFSHSSYDEEAAIREARKRLKLEQQQHAASPNPTSEGMISALSRVIKEWEQDRAKKNTVSELTKTNILTHSESRGKSQEVKLLLPNLLERLRKQTESSGKKSELAEFLGAPLASVSRWLSGDREPGGEVTLKMLYWVERQERK